MTQFNSVEAARDYAEKSDEELACIAHVNSDYLPEARAIAVRELEKRGVAEDRSALIARARVRAKENRKAAALADAITHEKSEQIQVRLGGVVLIACLWIGALMAPDIVKTSAGSFDGVVLSIGWAVAAFFAIRKARQGKPRQLYLVVVVPAVLLVVGIAFRWMT